MNTMTKYLVKVEYIESRLLTNIDFVPTSTGMGVLLNYWRNWQTLPTVGIAAMTVKSATTGKSRVYTTTLTAILSHHFDAGNRRLCYLVTAVDGSRYLIGADEPPYPTTETEDNMPSSVAEKCSCQLAIEYKNTLGIIEVLD